MFSEDTLFIFAAPLPPAPIMAISSLALGARALTIAGNPSVAAPVSTVLRRKRLLVRLFLSEKLLLLMMA
jgi:hypothetical protein